MENIKTFENLFIRQESKKIFIDFYNKFSNSEFRDYFFKDQILRSSLSISNNIAEWFERMTNKELIYFLYIAKWSSWETRNMILIWKELNFITKEEFDNYNSSLIKISAWINKLINSKK